MKRNKDQEFVIAAADAPIGDIMEPVGRGFRSAPANFRQNALHAITGGVFGFTDGGKRLAGSYSMPGIPVIPIDLEQMRQPAGSGGTA